MKNTFSVNCISIALIVSSVLMLTGCTEPRTNAGPVQSAVAVEQAAEPNESDGVSQTHLLEDQWGIQVERAVLSAGGYMVDFRFRVLDAAKAAPILVRSVSPQLIDQATGATFIVPSPPKIGQLRRWPDPGGHSLLYPVRQPGKVHQGRQ